MFLEKKNIKKNLGSLFVIEMLSLDFSENY